MNEFEPLVLAFCCNWCTYASADVIGTIRIQYPHNVRIVRVMCSGMVDPIYILRAFEAGIDGVLVCGCHYVDCHYINGPLKCDAMFNRLKGLVNILGLEDERLRRKMVAASEGLGFVAIVEETVDQLKKLGPSPFKKARKEAIA